MTVAAIYYVFTLRTNQRNMKASLETRQAQLFMSSMFDRISSQEFRRANSLLEKYHPKTRAHSPTHPS